MISKKYFLFQIIRRTKLVHHSIKLLISIIRIDSQRLGLFYAKGVGICLGWNKKFASIHFNVFIREQEVKMNNNK